MRFLTWGGGACGRSGQGGAEQPGRDLADGAEAAGGFRHGARRGAYRVVRARDGHGPAGECEAGEVVDVVADVQDAFGGDGLLVAPLLEREVLAVDAVQDGDAELVGAGGDDRVLFRGEDQEGDARLAQGGDAEPVAPVDGDGLAAVGVDEDPVVGLGAVEVEDDRVDVLAGGQPSRVQERGQGAGPGQVVRVVDLQDAGGVGAHQRGVAEEAVAVGTESGRVHRVGGARFEEVLGAVLATGADLLVVVDAVVVVLDRAAVAPQEAMERGDGDGRVGAFPGDRGGDAVDVLAGDEGAGALDEQHHVHGLAVLRLVAVQRVQDGGLAGRGVARDGFGALDAVQPAALAEHFGGGPRGLGEGGGVGRHDDVRHLARREAGADRADDERDAADLGEVLGGYALGSATGGDHGQHGGLLGERLGGLLGGLRHRCSIG